MSRYAGKSGLENPSCKVGSEYLPKPGMTIVQVLLTDDLKSEIGGINMSEIYQEEQNRQGIDWGFWFVVVIFMFILFLILAPNFVRTNNGGPYTQCQSNLKNIGTALEMYSTDNLGRYPRTLSQLTPDYLKIIPTCAAAGIDTYSQGFESNNYPEEKIDRYTVFCQGDYHQWTRAYYLYFIPYRKRSGLSVPRNYPQYNSTDGLVAK